MFPCEDSKTVSVCLSVLRVKKSLLLRQYGSCLKTGQHSIFVIIYLLLTIKYLFFDSVSKIPFNFFMQESRRWNILRRISIVAIALSALTYIDFQLTEEDAISKFHGIISSSKLFCLCYWIALPIRILIMKILFYDVYKPNLFSVAFCFFYCVWFLASAIMILIMKTLLHNVIKIINK